MKELCDDYINSATKYIAEQLEFNEFEFYVPLLSMSETTTILEGLGATLVGYLDSNGWDADYWQDIEINGKKYLVNGNGYYGGVSLRMYE